MGLKDKILKILREEKGFVSGEAIRQTLKVSRTAVWKQIETLREEGHEIESSPNRGYRMIQEADKLSEPEILKVKGLQDLPLKIKILEETDSTNRVATDLALEGAPEGTIVLAERQSAGRGRLGRVWESPSHKNLYLSVVLKPPIPPAATLPITLVAGIACYEALKPELSEALNLKWPNDLWVQGKKIGGILTDMEAEQDQVRFIILGIGVNVNAESGDFSKELQPLATSLRMETGRTSSRSQIAGRVLERLFHHYRRFVKEGFSALKETWETYARMKGRAVRVEEGDRTFEGTVNGLNPDGFLLVKTPAGTERVVAGDVFWI